MSKKVKCPNCHAIGETNTFHLYTCEKCGFVSTLKEMSVAEEVAEKLLKRAKGEDE